MGEKKNSIWIFGDYRNYFQNRVTLQLLSRANELAGKINASVCAVVLGNNVSEWVGEYIAHGAQKVYVIEHPQLENYSIETYSFLMEMLITTYKPELVLIGATMFGREFAPKLAKKLKTGLTADCIGLEINDDGLLVQIAPAFGGNLIAEIVTPECRPQMATVRPGTFQEIPHDYNASGEVIRIALPEYLPEEKVRLISSKRWQKKGQKIEAARVVVCGGRGMGSKKNYKNLFELAQLLGGEVGATRPVVYANWVDEEALVGQTGKHIRPKVLFSFGISGAIQHTAALSNAGFIIAINKNVNATMMKMADVAIVADTNQICSTLIKELKKRIRS
ncbi:MAG: electron transfer flavoprotein subunit alpha/FixB family protein [Syntrophales bacterium]